MAEHRWRGLYGQDTLVHLANCPHLKRSDAVFDVLSPHPSWYCEWSRREIGGEGRRYHDSVDDAIRDLNPPRYVREKMARLLAARMPDRRVTPPDPDDPTERGWEEALRYMIYVTGSGSTIVVVDAWDEREIATAGKTWVEYDDEWPAEGRVRIDLREDAGLARPLDTCPRCFQVKSATGACGCT